MNQNPEYGVCAPQAYKEDGKLLPTIDHFSSPTKELFGRNFLEFINPEKYPRISDELPPFKSASTTEFVPYT